MISPKPEIKIPKVDKTKCTGCGTCAALCPEVFGLGEDGFSYVKVLPSYDNFSIQDCVDSCPNQAIGWDK
ncbi:MAG TPA: ferredoxin [Patescibacteria group bacterium]|nr:ferredoxin [Patescibacteria group bacterium]